MNRWFWRVIIAAALVVVAVCFTAYFFPAPSEPFALGSLELAKSASFGGNEPPLAAMANAQRVAGFFMEDVQIQVELPGRVGATVSGRDEWRDKTIALRSLGAGLPGEFLDINIIVASDKNSAEANLTLKGRIAGEKDSYCAGIEDAAGTKLTATGRLNGRDRQDAFFQSLARGLPLLLWRSGERLGEEVVSAYSKRAAPFNNFHARFQSIPSDWHFWITMTDFTRSC